MACAQLNHSPDWIIRRSEKNLRIIMTLENNLKCFGNLKLKLVDIMRVIKYRDNHLNLTEMGSQESNLIFKVRKRRFLL